MFSILFKNPSSNLRSHLWEHYAVIHGWHELRVHSLSCLWCSQAQNIYSFGTWRFHWKHIILSWCNCFHDFLSMSFQLLQDINELSIWTQLAILRALEPRDLPCFFQDLQGKDNLNPRKTETGGLLWVQDQMGFLSSQLSLSYHGSDQCRPIQPALIPLWSSFCFTGLLIAAVKLFTCLLLKCEADKYIHHSLSMRWDVFTSEPSMF